MDLVLAHILGSKMFWRPTKVPGKLLHRMQVRPHRVQTIPRHLTGSNSQNMGDLRIDHDFNDSNRLYGVYHESSQKTASSPVSAPCTRLGFTE